MFAFGFHEPFWGGSRSHTPGEVPRYRITPGEARLTFISDNDQAGSVSYTVYILFIAIQAAGPLVGLLLTPPNKVQRKDGKKVSCRINEAGHITGKLLVANDLSRSLSKYWETHGLS